MTLPITIGLRDESGHFGPEVRSQLAMALNQQIADLRREYRYVPPAAVQALAGDPAPTMWVIHVQSSLDDPDALGYHWKDGTVPYSRVLYTDAQGTPGTISHELVEMVVDPWGMRQHQAQLPAGLESRYADVGLRHKSSQVSYLLEVADPCERTSYLVNGFRLSDFIFLEWYRTNPRVQLAYSFTGGCRRPREVADGGYVSFSNPASREWFQAFNRAGTLDLRSIGRFEDHKGSVSLREFTDVKAREYRARN